MYDSKGSKTGFNHVHKSVPMTYLQSSAFKMKFWMIFKRENSKDMKRASPTRYGEIRGLQFEF